MSHAPSKNSNSEQVKKLAILLELYYKKQQKGL